MPMHYSDDDLLMLSGIQHIAFCERQYALAYIEMQWSENRLTIEGHHLHERVDDPLESDTRNDVVNLRAVPIASYRLGLSGIADVIEFFRTDSIGLVLPGHSGKWHPHPVEYKRGKPKPDDRDQAVVKAAGGALCLFEQNAPTKKSAGVTRGVTQQHPTHGMVLRAISIATAGA